MACTFPDDNYLSFATKQVCVDGFCRGPLTSTGQKALSNSNKNHSTHSGDQIFGPPKPIFVSPHGISNHPKEHDPGSNPASGCKNCGKDIWNPGNWACQIQKAACEAGHAASGGLGTAGSFLPLVAIGGAAILLIVLLKR